MSNASMNLSGTGERQADVVVVGAGLAGLAAAQTLAGAGVDVVVLEARNRVGGRTYTKPARAGTPLDLGAQWIGPTQHRLAALAESVGVTTFRMYDTGNNLQFQDGQRTIYSGAIPIDDPLVAMETVETMLQLNLMANEAPLDAPWEAAKAGEWDTHTVATWMENNVSSQGVRKLLALAIQSVFSAEPRDISLLHVLFYIHSAGSLKQLISVTGGAQESRFHGGAQQISLTSSPWLKPWGSSPRGEGFLLHWLTVSLVPACTQASALTSTGLNSRKPCGIYFYYSSSVAWFLPLAKIERSVHWSNTVVFLPVEPNYHGTRKHYFVVNVRYTQYRTNWNKCQQNKRFWLRPAHLISPWL